VIDAVAPDAPDEKTVHTARRVLLERVVATEPKDLPAIAELALVREALGERAQCEGLLIPHRDRLGTTEGARILAQIFAARGDVENALALLLPYAESRIELRRAAESRFDEVRKSIVANVLSAVRYGGAQGFSYEHYRKAAPAEQDHILVEYLDYRLKDDPAFKAAQQVVERETKVVQLVLKLGLDQLRRARRLADPAKLRAELDRAEKTLLAARRLGEDSDELRLSLAQVYSRLGRQNDASKLFTDTLTAAQRSSGSLLGVARGLCALGSQTEARGLIEEAYEKEPDPLKKQESAYFRATLHRDTDDEWLWLSRANPADALVKAAMGANRAQKLIERGRDAEAAVLLRQTIDLYAPMPEDENTLRSSARAYFQLFELTGEKPNYERGRALFEKAVALDPSNGQVTEEAAHLILEGALRELITPTLNLRAVNSPPDPSLLGFLYGDDAGRKALAGRIREDAGVRRGIALYEKLLALAPTNPRAYRILEPLYELMDDREALRSLLIKLVQVNLDLGDETAWIKDRYAGRNDDRRRADLAAALLQAKAIVDGARRRGRDTTFAVAANALAFRLIEGANQGLEVHSDEVVRLAEEAHAAAPSEATEWFLTQALCFRASLTILRTNADYARIVAQSYRSTDHAFLLAKAVEDNGPLRSAILANADIQRAVNSWISLYKKDPKVASGWAWLLLRAARPDWAGHVAQRLSDDEAGALRGEIEIHLHPLDANRTIEAYAARLAAGQVAEAAAILKQAAARGVPLPFDPS
jgi:hypothetical protein